MTQNLRARKLYTGAAAIVLLLLTLVALSLRSPISTVEADLISGGSTHTVNGASGGAAHRVVLPAVFQLGVTTSTATPTRTQTQAGPANTATDTPTQTQPAATATSSDTPTQTQPAAMATSTDTQTPTRPPPAADLWITALDWYNKPEYVTITNYGNAAQDMTGWTIVSIIGSETYEFPDGFTLAANSSVVVQSDLYSTHSPPYVLFWSYADIWYQFGDKAELRSDTNELIHSLCYAGGCG